MSRLPLPRTAASCSCAHLAPFGLSVAWLRGRHYRTAQHSLIASPCFGLCDVAPLWQFVLPHRSLHQESHYRVGPIRAAFAAILRNDCVQNNEVREVREVREAWRPEAREAWRPEVREAWRHEVREAWRHEVRKAWRHEVREAWRHEVREAWRHEVREAAC